jgi:hypothetical protein
MYPFVDVWNVNTTPEMYMCITYMRSAPSPSNYPFIKFWLWSITIAIHDWNPASEIPFSRFREKVFHNARGWNVAGNPSRIT